MAQYIIGPVSCSGSQGSNFQGRVVIDETVDTSANTSTIAWSFQIFLGNSQYVSNYSYSNGNAVSVVIDGTTIVNTANIGTVALNNRYISNPFVLTSGTRTIAHGTDGSKSLSVTASYTQNNSAYLKNITVSGTIALTKIPRASAVDSVSDITIGGTPTVKWTPAVSTYTYKITFSYGTWSHTTELVSPGSTTQQTYASYAIPTSVAEQITNATSGTATCKITTYSDSGGTTELGSATKNFTITIPNDSTYQPTASITVTSVNPFNSYNLTDRTSYNYSCESSAGKSGATISSYAVRVTNTAGTVIHTGSSSTGSVGAVSTATTLTFSLTVTDSRGYSASTSQSVVVTAYQRPSVTAEITRGTGTVTTSNTCTNFVVDEAGGTKARISYTTSYSSSITGNSLTVQIQYPSNAAGTTTATKTVTANPAYFLNNINYSSETSYTFIVSVYDTVGGSANKTSFEVVLSSARYPIDFMADASGMGINKVATRSGSLQVDWNLEIHGGNSIKFYNSSDVMTSEIKAGTIGVLFTVYGFNGGGINLAALFGRNIQGAVSVVPRGYSEQIKWYVVDATPSSYSVAVYNADGSTFSSQVAFDIVAIPA